MSKAAVWWQILGRPEPPPVDRFLAMALNSTPFIEIHDYVAATPVKLSDPATLPAGAAYGASFSPDGTLLAIAHDTSPFLTVYEISGNVFTKIANPATLPLTGGRSVAFSPDGAYLAVGTVSGGSNETLNFYSVSGSSLSFLGRVSGLLGSIITLAWAPGSSAVIANNSVYNPATQALITALPTSASVIDVAWDVGGDLIGRMLNTTPFVSFVNWNSGSPVAQSNPSTLPPSTGRGIAFMPDGSLIAPTVHSHVGASPGNDGTTYDCTTDPATLAASQMSPEPSSAGSGGPQCIAIRSESDKIAVGTSQSARYLWVYDGFSSEAVAAQPGSIVRGIAWGGIGGFTAP